MFRGTRISTQALIAQVGVLLLVLGAGFALTTLMLRRTSEQQYEQRALAVALSVAEDPTVIARIQAGKDPDGEVEKIAQAVRARTGMLFVVVTDRHGIRYSHPDEDEIGKEVSTPPVALDGSESVSIERGTLGVSARAKVPLRDAGGTVIGEVSVGAQVGTALGAATPLILEEAVFCVAALLVGAAVAALLTRRLKRQTLGLEPVELAELLREQQAVLGGVGDGVLAVDTADRITACNKEAARLLGGPIAPGTKLADAGLPDPVHRAVAERLDLWQSVVTVGARILVLSAQPVRRGERDLGHVLTLRDRTELDELERERSSLRALSDALRAQAHEYTNRLHTLSGMLANSEVAEARSYLRELAAAPIATEGQDGGRIADPYLRGLLAAKTATASEHGVHLRLDEDSYLPRRLTDPLDAVSIVGNLLDNAVRAAENGRRRPAWAELSLLAEGDTLLVAVADSGDGVRAEEAELLFRPGYSSRRAEDRDGHGIGLSLARQLAVKHAGELRLGQAAGPGHGAVFLARLPGALERQPAEAEPAQLAIHGQEK